MSGLNKLLHHLNWCSLVVVTCDLVDVKFIEVINAIGCGKLDRFYVMLRFLKKHVMSPVGYIWISFKLLIYLCIPLFAPFGIMPLYQPLHCWSQHLNFLYPLHKSSLLSLRWISWSFTVVCTVNLFMFPNIPTTSSC